MMARLYGKRPTQKVGQIARNMIEELVAEVKWTRFTKQGEEHCAIRCFC